MRTNSILLAAAALLLSAACNKEPVPAGEITVQASVGEPTKVAYDGVSAQFKPGDEIAVYAWTGDAAKVPTDRVVDGVVNTLGTDKKWTPASKMLWLDGSTPHFFLGVFPAPAAAISDFSAVPFTLESAEIAKSDLLTARNFGPQDVGLKSSTGTVNLTFEHMMARLDVNLKFRNQWDDTPSVSGVTVDARKTATVNYITKAFTATGDASAIDIPAVTAVPSGYKLGYSGLQIPQDDVRKITITVDGKEFIYEAGTDITLVGGKITTVGLNVGRDKLELGDISIADWTLEADLGDNEMRQTY